MHRRVTFGSRHRRRGSSHYQRLIRGGLAVTLILTLAGCTTLSRDVDHPQARSVAPPPTAAGSHVAPGFAGAPGLMVDGALSMLGQPYRFGGAAPGGFDCSGLVEYAASGAGIRLPRTAHEQFRSGEPIARGDLRAGDLIFMHLAHKELHVAIAIDGERFVHAPSRGGRVRIDTLAAPPYAGGFVSARRVIPEP